jgi:glucose-6-phosphate 1-dehydrogenase
MFTLIEGLDTSFAEVKLEELLRHTTAYKDVYTLLKDKQRNIYYLALNGSIFLVTVSPIAAYAMYNRATELELQPPHAM